MAKEKESRNNVIEDALKGCYGSRATPSAVKQWLIDNILDNVERDVPITLNVMGAPGTSKTALVKSLATTPIDWDGKHYDGFEIIDIPIAQVEEMGDVLGYPEVFVEMERDIPDEE
jgi:hypothetical protein